MVSAGLIAVAQTNYVNANEHTNSITTASEPDPAAQQKIDELNRQIEEKRGRIDELKRQTALYERRLEQQQDQRASLQLELEQLGESIDNTKTELELNTIQLEALQLEIQKVEREIASREQQIADHRSELGELLRQLYQSDQVSHLELIVQEQSFSDFFSRVQQLYALSTSIEERLTDVLEVKRQLDSAEADLAGKRSDLDATRQDLEAAHGRLLDQERYKVNLLDATKDSEQKYEALLGELRGQASAVDTEITSLIDQVNQRLADRGETITVLKPGQLTWPVDASRGISAYFHDPTYPFRKIFEHPAIDIRAVHGTPVAAAGDGVVAIARKFDWVRNGKGDIMWPAYNFVTIVHGGNLATVYGHLSQVSVNEGDTVKQGQVIGRSGATPGTAGAGRLTTGPHLHFEVRVSGIPDDPLKYLPAQ
ncbi:MAG: peptidoglycan DD-metalloendopeptidase family protein [Candidatus Kerfeldbacteria bacterium]|nr:peptidoglycan DD-metalloendopeptidase family protein [Candidatus Kerfeldbacteria bacterium]